MIRTSDPAYVREPMSPEEYARVQRVIRALPAPPATMRCRAFVQTGPHVLDMRRCKNRAPVGSGLCHVHRMVRR